MDFLDKVVENLKDLARKLIEMLLGPDVAPEPEQIPIPVRDQDYYR